MSKSQPPIVTKRPSALLSAALRHVRDAEHLLDCSTGYTSPDQAYHLAGFGPECARKATIGDDWLDKVIGHGATEWADEMLDFAASMDPIAHRYHLPNFRSRFPALAAWTINARYAKTGDFTQHGAPVCREARDVVDAIVIDLWADGRLDDSVAFR